MYYIYDCLDNIVGNQNGYRTIKGAIIQQNKIGSKAYNEIWSKFYAQNYSGSGHEICSIKFSKVD